MVGIYSVKFVTVRKKQLNLLELLLIIQEEKIHETFGLMPKRIYSNQLFC